MLKMILILVLPLLLRKKKQLRKTTKMQRGKEKPNKVSTNVNDNSNMMYKSYQDQNLPNVLPFYTPVRETGFYLDAPLLRGKYVTPIEFF